jgi:hypothetical protein
MRPVAGTRGSEGFEAVRKIRLAACLVVLLAPAIAPGETELVLHDGRVLTGTSARREGENYVLILEGGEVVTLPVELVESVNLRGRSERKAPTPYVYAEPQTLAGVDPPGLVHAEPQTLAGRPVEPPSTSEQLEVLGPPARFQQDIIDPTWVPESDWNMDPSQNDFNPARWSKGVVDPTWQPQSGFDEDEDVLAGSRSTWSKSPVDSTWEPTDGFKSRGF